MTRDEVARRLAVADRRIRLLRRCTLDLSALRRHLLGERRHGPDRPALLRAEAAERGGHGRALFGGLALGICRRAEVQRRGASSCPPAGAAP